MTLIDLSSCGTNRIDLAPFGTLTGSMMGCDRGSRLSQTFAVGMVRPGEWYHVAHVWTLSAQLLYLNGELVSHVAITEHTHDRGIVIMIGQRASFAGSFFAGLLDEIRIWNVARSAEDIALYRAVSLAPTVVGLTGYFQFNEGSGNAGTSTSPRYEAAFLDGADWYTHVPFHPSAAP